MSYTAKYSVRGYNLPSINKSENTNFLRSILRHKIFLKKDNDTYNTFSRKNNVDKLKANAINQIET